MKLHANAALSLNKRRLLVCRVVDRLPGARAQAPAHPPAPPADQRQGRALHPHAARRLGLRSDLSQLGGAHSRPRRLALALQLQASTRLPRPPTTGLKTEQRGCELHLELGRE